jgi:hypothetical protein
VIEAAAASPFSSELRVATRRGGIAQTRRRLIDFNVSLRCFRGGDFFDQRSRGIESSSSHRFARIAWVQVVTSRSCSERVYRLLFRRTPTCSPFKRGHRLIMRLPVPEPQQ